MWGLLIAWLFVSGKSQVADLENISTKRPEYRWMLLVQQNFDNKTMAGSGEKWWGNIIFETVLKYRVKMENQSVNMKS